MTTDISKDDDVGIIFFTQGDKWSSSINNISGGSVVGFYTAIVLILGNTIRNALFGILFLFPLCLTLFLVNQAYIYLNMPNSEVLLQVCEGLVYSRS